MNELSILVSDSRSLSVQLKVNADSGSRGSSVLLKGTLIQIQVVEVYQFT